MKARKWTWMLRLIVLAMVVISTVVLFRLRAQIRHYEEVATELSAQKVTKEQENQRLQEEIDALETDDGVRDVARKELGMVASGEIVFRDVG